ncbi:MAG: ATP-binding cassette domain-containing protein [Cyclobacteriaceae bacterium]|nr:ATP-binding cassette domain-containing protein [Cyclobacteriaceae bacterium HetDA_MAG_MS6]
MPFVRKYAEKARESWNDIFVHLENLVVGIKELSMNKDFRTTYMDDLLIPKSKIQNEYKIRENLVSSLASKTTDMILLLGIAILIIVIGRTQFVEISFFGEYLTLVLFTVAPLSSAAGFLGSIKKIEVALEQVERAGMSLNDLPGHEMLEPGTNKWTPDRPILELRSVEHEYYHVDEEENFNLGPIDLAIRGGEILFLIGGNGSGKTTLAKLISGLYTPKSGEVYYKNQKVKPDLVEDFRDRFSAIFTDSLVFEELLHLKKGRLEKEGKELIEAFGLKKKVRIENGRFTTTKLSEGQRKRLGLIKSFLEDKEIYLFDEWAANQDPSFKEIFYTSILAKLKDKGKAVIVITHDDQYFDLADKTVKLMNGKLSDLVPAN